MKRVWDNKISHHDIFASADIKSMSKTCSKMHWHGTHVHIFCSVLQLGQWYRVLFKEVEEQKETGPPGSDYDQEEMKNDKLIFEGEYIPLQYTRAVGTPNRSPTAYTTRRFNVAQEAVDFWCMGLVPKRL